MIEKIPSLTPPLWLMNISVTSMNIEPFPLKNVLQDSLYYPGAGTDGKPVKWFAGNTYSFIYTDYGVPRSEFLNELQSDQSGFTGYRILGTRDLTMKELIPNGWIPMSPSEYDGNPLAWHEVIAQPFCIWTVFERLLDYTEEHGPERFSLLYLCGEGAASYQALYNSNRIKPKILFLIQHAFGCNWTNFEDPEAILARSVASNAAGMPDWLIGRSRPNTEESEDMNLSYWPYYYPGPYIHYLDGWHGYAVWPLKNKR